MGIPDHLSKSCKCSSKNPEGSLLLCSLLLIIHFFAAIKIKAVPMMQMKCLLAASLGDKSC